MRYFNKYLFFKSKIFKEMLKILNSLNHSDIGNITATRIYSLAATVL